MSTRALVHFALVIGMFTSAAQASAPFVTAADLMRPESFPTASFGMQVKSAEDGDVCKVVTTGAEFLVHKAERRIECVQRIGKQRRVAVLFLPPNADLSDLKVTHRSSGAIIAANGSVAIRVNGDSILMLQISEPSSVHARLDFEPDACFSIDGNYNLFDPAGGISFFDHASGSSTGFVGDDAADASREIRWEMPAGAVLWAAVSPPKPFDWNAANDGYVVWGSSYHPYVSEEQIQQFAKHAKVLHIHSEMMLWKKWQSDLTPRDLPRLRRLVTDAHRHGMKLIVYTTPLYYLKGTPREHEQRIDPDPDPTKSIGHVPSWGKPDNEHFFLEQITRAVKDSGVDGVYIDGIYFDPAYLAASYHLTRSLRELVTDEGVLSFHASADTPSRGGLGARTYCPPLNAYYDYILRGEGEETNVDPAFVRYFQSTYNLSNSIALACHFTDYRATPEHVDLLLRNNIRLPLSAGSLAPGGYADNVLAKHYWPQLPQLREQIEADLAKPTGAFRHERERRNAIAAHLQRQERLGAQLKAEDVQVPDLAPNTHYWRFEEPAGLALFDGAADSPRHGKIKNGVTRSKKVFAPTLPQLNLPNARCIEIDGTNGSGVTVGREIDVADDDFTLEAWINPRSAHNRPVVAGKRISGTSKPSDTGWEIYLVPEYTVPGVPTFRLQFAVRQHPGESSIVQSDSLTFGEWHHVAGVREGKQIRLYIDGALVADTEVTAGDISSDQEFCIGSGREGGGGSLKGAFDGFIDEVRLTVGRALSPSSFLLASGE